MTKEMFHEEELKILRKASNEIEENEKWWATRRKLTTNVDLD